MAPIASIVVPVHDTAQFLPRCLDSLLGQTLREIEIVCVDDGSTDGSADILRNYAAKDPRIVALFQENHGVEWARAAAMERARGKYVMFCDSDDAYAPEMCEKMADAVERNGTDLAVCGVESIGFFSPFHSEDGVALPESPCGPFQNDSQTWGNVWLWNKIFKRETIDRTGLSFPKDPRIRRGYDAVFTFLYSLVAERAAFLPDLRVKHYRREGSITSFRSAKKLRSTLDDTAHLPRVLDFVDRNGFFRDKKDLVLRWIDHRIAESFLYCNDGQRTEAIRLFGEALSARSADIRPEYAWLCAVLARDEATIESLRKSLLRRKRHERGPLQRICDGIADLLGWLGVRAWLRDLLFRRSTRYPRSRTL